MKKILIVISIFIETFILYKLGTSQLKDYFDITFCFFIFITIYFYSLTCKSLDETDIYNGPSGDFFCDM